MPVTHEELMARLPELRQARIKARAAELQREVEGLGEIDTSKRAAYPLVGGGNRE